MAYDVGFIGYGRMAQAISEGLNRNGLVPYENQAASDVQTQILEMANSRDFHPVANNLELVKNSKVVILAVKPHQVKTVLSEIGPVVSSQLFISIAAGIKLDFLASFLPESLPVVRVIPNLPALVGKGVTLVCARPSVSQKDLNRVHQIFEAVGVVLDLDEAKFDEGTAVSGSGPAYFFMFMEGLIRGAVRLGLTWDVARQLVLQTALGSAEAALAHPDMSLSDLRDQVTSPGGTTAEGLLALEEGGMTALLHLAVKAATDKAKQLA